MPSGDPPRRCGRFGLGESTTGGGAMDDAATIRNRRTIRSFRNHLWLSGAIGTLVFSVVIGLSIFAPIVAQLGESGARASELPGLTKHFLFLSESFWPLVLVSLVASVATSNLLFRRMRAPLVRYVRIYAAIADGFVPAQLAIRASDYLTEETDALNAMIASLRRQQALRIQAAARIDEIVGDLVTRGVEGSELAELQEIAKRLAVGQRES